jgi:hypothetical protein
LRRGRLRCLTCLEVRAEIFRKEFGVVLSLRPPSSTVLFQKRNLIGSCLELEGLNSWKTILHSQWNNYFGRVVRSRIQVKSMLFGDS